MVAYLVAAGMAIFALLALVGSYTVLKWIW